MLLEIFLVFSILIIIWIAITFRRWRKTLIHSLTANSELIETSAGEIEYVLRGDGPVVLMLHGAPGGYDQSLLDAEMWISNGFSVLAISRPGYLRTPLTVGETFEEQANAIDALLTSLDIPSVVVLGASAGGPVAIQLTLNHSDKVSALVLVAAVSKEYIVRESQKRSVLGRIFLSETTADLGVWFYDILTRRWPSLSLKEMFKENVGLNSEELGNYVKQVMSIPEQVEWFRRFIRTTCPMSLRMTGMNNDLEHLEDVSFSNLSTIICPTLVIHGTADKDVAFSNAEFSVSEIPNARMYKLENVGHIVWLGDHVLKMNSDIIDFIRGVIG